MTIIKQITCFKFFSLTRLGFEPANLRTAGEHDQRPAAGCHFYDNKNN